MTGVLEISVRVPPPDSLSAQADVPVASRCAASERFADALRRQLLAQNAQPARDLESPHEAALTHESAPLVDVARHESGLPHVTVPPYEPEPLHTSTPRHEPDPAHESTPSHSFAQGSELPGGDLPPVVRPPMTGEVAQPMHRATVVSMTHATARRGAPSVMPAATGRAAGNIDLRGLRAEVGSHPAVAPARVAAAERSDVSTSVATVPSTDAFGTAAESAARIRDGSAAGLQTALAVQGRMTGSLPVANPDGAKDLAGSTPSEAATHGAAERRLIRALGERLHVHVTRRAEQATIRLDPPHMGTIDIDIRHESGSLQVHLRASHAEVARQLHAIGDSLRQELAQRQSGEVSVFVYDASREGEGRQRQRQTAAWSDEPGRALDVAHDGERSEYFSLLPDEE
jgi:Flagellar hook-length control protein